MVRFSDLLGQGDDGDAAGDAARDATPTEPVPTPPTEPPPPPPPASSGNELLDRLTSYASRSAAVSSHADENSEPSRSQADERLVASLQPVDDDLLPKRRRK
jgi:hypothetical protein